MELTPLETQLMELRNSGNNPWKDIGLCQFYCRTEEASMILTKEVDGWLMTTNIDPTREHLQETFPDLFTALSIASYYEGYAEGYFLGQEYMR